MEEKKIVFGGVYPIEHVFVNDVLDIGDLEDNVFGYMHKAVIQAVKAHDEKMMDEILRVAKENGVTDLWLIDEEFVLTALKREIKRRRRKAWWKKLWKRN
jgi:hypothetical protein